MSANAGTIAPSGDVELKLIKGKKKVQRAPLAWRLQNSLRPGFIKGWIAKHFVIPFANAWGVMCAIAELELTLIKADGTRIEYGVVSYRVVTDAGVAFLVDALDNTVEAEIMNYHGVGTGTNAEAVGDTALQTESTTILNPNSTRATGTQTQPSANIYRSTGTNTFDGSGAITEHGLLSQAATGGGTLLDRSVFSAINVANLDSLQSQYSLTLTSGS